MLVLWEKQFHPNICYVNNLSYSKLCRSLTPNGTERPTRSEPKAPRWTWTVEKHRLFEKAFHEVRTIRRHVFNHIGSKRNWETAYRETNIAKTATIVA